MKVLLVDDDGFLRDMYSVKFSSSGYDVDAADGAPAVISKLQQGAVYDLVVLDMVMPGTSGVELLKIIKAEFPKQAHCCVFLSNQGQEEDIREATEAGADGYIIKAETIPSEVVKRVEVIMKQCKSK